MDENLKSLLEQAIHYSTEEQGWTLFSDVNEVQVHTHDYPKSVYPIIKVSTTFNQPLDEVVNYIWGLKEPELKKMDDMTLSVQDSDETENYRIREICTLYPWPIWNRHTVFQMQKIYDGDTNTYWILQKTFTSHKYPLKEQHVRATWNIGAYKFIDLGDNKTQLVRLLHCDEGGNVPTMFLYHNQMLVRYSLEFEKMKADIAAKI